MGPVEDKDTDLTPEFRLTDEASGTTYVLVSGFVDFSPFAGQRVTIAGAPIGDADDAPPALNVTRIQPVDGPSPGPAPGTSATFDFELTVKGQPPAGTRFFGVVPAEGCISVPLSQTRTETASTPAP